MLQVQLAFGGAAVARRGAAEAIDTGAAFHRPDALVARLSTFLTKAKALFHTLHVMTGIGARSTFECALCARLDAPVKALTFLYSLTSPTTQLRVASGHCVPFSEGR